MPTSTVTIEARGDGYSSKGRVVIDGQALPNVRSAKTSLTVDKPPVVTLELNRVQNIKIENASIVVSDVAMPASVEQVLWKYLAKKYRRVIDVTKLGLSARDGQS